MKLDYRVAKKALLAGGFVSGPDFSWADMTHLTRLLHCLIESHHRLTP
jgi:hypothetical protein